jgi:hypothetical protein
MKGNKKMIKPPTPVSSSDDDEEQEYDLEDDDESGEYMNIEIIEDESDQIQESEHSENLSPESGVDDKEIDNITDDKLLQ